MTKTTKKQLIEEYVAKAMAQRDLAKELHFGVVRESRDEYTKIRKDTRLSPDGKAMEMQAARSFYAEQFLRKMADLRKNYTQNMEWAQKLAYEVKAEVPETTASPSQVQAFEHELADLKTRALLHPMPDKAVDLIETFSQKYRDPYFSHRIASSFHELAAPVANRGSHEVKESLSRLYDGVTKYATTEAQAYAQDVLDTPTTTNFILTGIGAPQFGSLVEAIGRHAAEASNDPERELTRLASGLSPSEAVFEETEQPAE